MCDFNYNRQSPVNRIMPDDGEGDGARAVKLQANEDRLHPEFSRILKAHCRDIAVMLEKEKGEKINER